MQRQLVRKQIRKWVLFAYLKEKEPRQENFFTAVQKILTGLRDIKMS
jgi:hypothetical protein